MEGAGARDRCRCAGTDTAALPCRYGLCIHLTFRPSALPLLTALVDLYSRRVHRRVHTGRRWEQYWGIEDGDYRHNAYVSVHGQQSQLAYK